MAPYHGLVNNGGARVDKKRFAYQRHEDEVVEFKKAENSFDFYDLGKYFPALSHEANLCEHQFAWLGFGVDNKTHAIMGTSYKRTGLGNLFPLEHHSCSNIKHPFVSEHEVRKKHARDRQQSISCSPKP